MNSEVIKKLGMAIGLVGGLAADIALTTILKSAAPQVVGKLNKAVLAAGIGFMGYAAGSAVGLCVQKDACDIAKQFEQAKAEAAKIYEATNAQTVFVVESVDIPADNH